MSSTEKEQHYLLSRDTTESVRLENQHYLILSRTGGPIDESLRGHDFNAIADIATGTGIWLRAVSDLLGPTSAGGARHYHGFDLSADQFPTDSGDMHYSVQDALKPFPAEHIGRYDLVHIRLLVVAIKKTDYNAVVTNVKSLLKPGGWLQWEEFQSLSFVKGNASEYPAYEEMMNQVYEVQRSLGFSLEPMEMVYDEVIKAGFEQVANREILLFTGDELSKTWLIDAIDGVLPLVYKLGGRASSDEAAQKMAVETVKKVRSMVNAGLCPGVTTSCVTGQKPL